METKKLLNMLKSNDISIILSSASDVIEMLALIEERLAIMFEDLNDQEWHELQAELQQQRWYESSSSCWRPSEAVRSGQNGTPGRV